MDGHEIGLWNWHGTTSGAGRNLGHVAGTGLVLGAGTSLRSTVEAGRNFIREAGTGIGSTTEAGRSLVCGAGTGLVHRVGTGLMRGTGMGLSTVGVQVIATDACWSSSEQAAVFDAC